MKIQLDTQLKTVSLIEGCKLIELIEALEKMLGEDYKNYTIQSNCTYWYYYPWYTWKWDTTPSFYTTSSGTPINIEITN